MADEVKWVEWPWAERKAEMIEERRRCLADWKKREREKWEALKREALLHPQHKIDVPAKPPDVDDSPEALKAWIEANVPEYAGAEEKKVPGRLERTFAGKGRWPRVVLVLHEDYLGREGIKISVRRKDGEGQFWQDAMIVPRGLVPALAAMLQEVAKKGGK